MLAAAVQALTAQGIALEAASPIITSHPLGPSRRQFANSVVLIQTPLNPQVLLASLQQIESRFGRKQRGGPWQARVVDLDIILWDGGPWSSPDLSIPHPMFRDRRFVLGPAMRIARHWRDPLTGLSLQQLNARLTKARPLPIAPPARSIF